MTDASNAEVTEIEAANALIRQARTTPEDQAIVRLVPGADRAAVYLVDEPELHLHPLAVRNVAEWLERLAETAATVIVATHHPTLLNTSRQLNRLVLVSRENGLTKLTPVQDRPLAAVTAINDEVGLTPGELLLLTRLVLLVEGEHDRTVLEAWFGDQLRAAAVRIIPLRGIDNLVGLPLTGLAQELGIPIAVLSDDTDVVAARSGVERTRGERAVGEFLRQAKQQGLNVKAIGLAQPDILYYLDDGICRQLAPGFPGWREAAAERRHAGEHTDWKRWITNTYGLRLDTATVRELAERCEDEGLIPEEMHGRLRSILAFASDAPRLPSGG